VFKEGFTRAIVAGRTTTPKGFTRYQVIATALDPRTMTLYGVREEEHSDVWDVVVEDLVNRMAEEDAAAGEKVACRWRLSSEFEVLREMVPDTGPVGACQRAIRFMACSGAVLSES